MRGMSSAVLGGAAVLGLFALMSSSKGASGGEQPTRVSFKGGERVQLAVDFVAPAGTSVDALLAPLKALGFANLQLKGEEAPNVDRNGSKPRRLVLLGDYSGKPDAFDLNKAQRWDAITFWMTTIWILP